MARLGVAISGGGHRAALFGLGVLLYLADVGKNHEVSAISSVSGGSITNAFVGLNGYREQNRDDFRRTASRYAAQIANRGTLFAWLGTKAYLAALLIGLLSTFLVFWLPWHWALRLGLWLVGLVIWEVALLRRRGQICGRAYAATVFGGHPVPRLAVIAHDEIDHVICATHLHAGEHTYFSGKFVYAYRFGWGTPGDVPLHVAVQASTALPGAFPPRWIRSERFAFSKTQVPSTLALVDGGVYDNMADQWLSGLARRRDKPDHVQEPDLIIVANASASMGMEGVKRMRFPLVGELLSLMRDVSIMYDNSASIRKGDLVDRFDAYASDEACRQFGRPGALLDISSDPFAAAEAFSHAHRWPERATRAKAALANKPHDWESDAAFVAAVPTNLSKLGVSTSARVIRHAYALAAMNLHVFLGFPLVNVPPLREFEELCRR